MNDIEITLNLFDFSTILYWDGNSFGLKSYTFTTENIDIQLRNARYKALNQFSDQAFQIEAASRSPASEFRKKYRYRPQYL